ncbi:Beta-lactamase [Chitinophaga terrae (ex Kim and Jung 2007)]|uniref:Beta-lactamase n=1 Tax=Chitinophaga terrae (ex Kim and Jung 2007) TaxID=408074 RepID=A0A1H3YT10_9BACT|nr:serine hydrolase domain-containing protein [Chitinophaga terrae (ex Kim and Jung 2007)]GEP88469.1 penicillin-binding protein [Chitinophaga terrae (ex Kim and Jung 2007)]SEA14192.1 Beta-lactamase [Chitinophaga terrae (ex Kim and Jung 2007)]
MKHGILLIPILFVRLLLPAQSLPVVDTAVMNFMRTYKVPGMAIAITHHGKLVYSKGYGLADSVNQVPVTANSLFRIASVSKSVTAAAILKLAKANRLNLDTTVFGPKGILGVRYGKQPYSSDLQAVTIRQLLQHTAGGWQNNGDDPMFLHPSMSADELISWTLDHQPLKNPPGKVFAYSNFGYCVLGRIIEKVSGQPYEDFVKAAILAPCGIRTMQTGGNTLADKRPGEVVYYGQNGENPYIYNISRMDAHGGWIASATDLAKLLVRLDGFPQPPDILSPASLQAFTTGSAANSGYALGVAVNMNRSWWHAGSLPGTASEIIRTQKGFNLVLLCNTRTDGPFFNDLDGLLWKAVNDPATPWPQEDLFTR